MPKRRNRAADANPVTPTISITTDSHHSVDTEDHTERCRRCRRPIWSQRSVSRHAGPVCYRELVAA
jgi:hypothetical protein